MMSRTLGAPFGGTTRGGHQGVDSEAFSLITPPNFGSGGGSCLPSIVVVAPGEPRRRVTCCAMAATDEFDASAKADDGHSDNEPDCFHATPLVCDGRDPT